VRHKYKHRLLRFLASGSPVLFVGCAAMAAASAPYVVSILREPASSTVTVSLNNPSIVWTLLVGLIVGLTLLFIQTWIEYRRRKFDPTWALKFSDIFDNPEMKRTRSRAAKALKDNATVLRRPDFSTADIDRVLDFFEDLGFYMDGDQITPEVVHHTFHHWIRGYYLAARDYLEAAQEEEPSQWEFVKILFDATNEIEFERKRRRQKKVVDAVGLANFFDGEIGLIKQGGA
jgi:hypothetical protein